MRGTPESATSCAPGYTGESETPSNAFFVWSASKKIISP